MLPNIMLVQIFFFGVLIPWAEMYEIKSGHDAMMFLNRFGYLDKNEMEHMEMTPGMEQGKEQMPVLKMYQKMCGLNTTGMLDTETMHMMNAPRCGNVDMEEGETDPDHRLHPNKTSQYDHRHHHHHRHNHNSLDNEIGHLRRGKRYVLYSAKTKWNKHLVTYKISMFSSRMGLRVTEAQVLEEIHEAFSIFQKHILLDFEHRPHDSKVDIDVAFTSQNHMQDRYPFDGPGSTLAHAFPPGNHRTSGMVHFDDVEDWSVKSPRGTNVLYVAVHEIGHALGLSHSQTKGAIMFPTYGGYRPVMQLHQDDIQGLQVLYGSRLPFTIPPKYPVATLPTTTTTTTKAPTTTTVRYQATTASWRPTPKYDPRDLCSDPKIDAITTLGDGNVYVFKGEYVYHLDSTGKGVKQGWPQHINTVFKGIPSHLDAVLTRSNKKSYFFKGDQYWRTTMKVVDSGYPKSISSNFIGIPNNIDAAFVKLGKMYFIKGDKYWRFDSMSKPFVSSIYPLPIQNWGIKTNKIDAAFVAPHDFIYLFGDRQYWRLQENKFQVSNVEPPYPRQSSLMWFACHPSYRADLRHIRRTSDEEDDAETEENESWDVSGESHHHHHHHDHDSHQGAHPHRVHRVRNAFMNFPLGPPF